MLNGHATHLHGAHAGPFALRGVEKR